MYDFKYNFRKTRSLRTLGIRQKRPWADRNSDLSMVPFEMKSGAE